MLCCVVGVGLESRSLVGWDYWMVLAVCISIAVATVYLGNVVQSLDMTLA